MDGHPWAASQIAIAGSIRRDEEFLVVEDLQGDPLAYTQSDILARLYFAAPGMLETMGRIATLCKKMSAANVDLEFQKEAVDILEDANLVMHAAIGIEIL